LMCYGDDSFVLPRPDKEVKIEFSGLTDKYRVVKYVIDKTHANAYTKFLELGEPQEASEEIQHIIREAGALREVDIGTVSPENYVLSVPMKNNAVVLLELFLSE